MRNGQGEDLPYASGTSFHFRSHASNTFKKSGQRDTSDCTYNMLLFPAYVLSCPNHRLQDPTLHVTYLAPMYQSLVSYADQQPRPSHRDQKPASSSRDQCLSFIRAVPSLLPYEKDKPEAPPVMSTILLLSSGMSIEFILLDRYRLG
jgi:hypothetical protein